MIYQIQIDIDLIDTNSSIVDYSQCVKYVKRSVNFIFFLHKLFYFNKKLYKL